MKDCGKYLPYILVGFGFLFVYNIVMLWSTGEIIETRAVLLKEAAIPLDVELLILTAPDCEKCSDLSLFMNGIKKLNINITEETQEAAAEEMIKKYQIATLPAIVLTATKEAIEKKSDVAKQLEVMMTKTDDTHFVYQTTIPPYYNVQTDELKGLVTVISITTPSCEECLELDSMIAALENALTLEEVVEVEYGTAEAVASIEKYNLEKVPVIIISEDAAAYEGFAETWEVYGSVEDDGSFVLRNTVPPYLDAATGKVHGLVDIIYLTDESCTECYNVTVHKIILQGFGVTIDEETTVDSADANGEALLEKYGITKVPTIILSKDAAAYKMLTEVWPQVGVIAEDGSYIFTAMEQLQGAKYRDLSTKEETGVADGEASV